MYDVINNFRNIMAESGIGCPDDIQADGCIHRFGTSDDKQGRRSGWYVLHVNPGFGRFGSWKTGIVHKWSAKRNDKTFSDFERVEFKKIITAFNRELEQSKLRCSERAQSIWQSATIASHQHPYLAAKQVHAFNIKMTDTGKLIVPVINHGTEIQGLQFIDSSGAKKFLSQSQIKGNYYLLGIVLRTIYIAEGYATAASIHMATGEAVAVVFNAGNILPAAVAIRNNYPKCSLVICADDDRWTEGNPGKTKAQEAADHVGAKLRVPEFTDLSDRPTDFNDLHRQSGLTEVKKQLNLESAQPQKHVSTGWQQPITIATEHAPELPAELLPSWVADYCKAVSYATQTPSGLAVLFSLAVIAACVQGKYEFVRGGHRETLCLWILAALEPGSRKTAVKSALTEPLTAWEGEQLRSHAKAMHEAKVTRDVMLKRADKLKDAAAKENIPEKRESILAEVAQIISDAPAEVHPPRLWTDDVTPERLQSLMLEQDGRMALLSDEGGIFEVMSGLYSNGRANLNVFLQAHTGSPVRVDRGSRTVSLDRPVLTFGIMVQPDIIRSLSKGGKSHFRGNGTLARFLYCIPINTIGHRDVRRNSKIPDYIQHAYHNGIRNLLNIQGQLCNGKPKPIELNLSAESQDAWFVFSQAIEGRLSADGELYGIQDWASKLPGAALRVASLMHLAECHQSPTPEIQLKTTANALELCTLLIPHARIAFNMMSAEPVLDDARYVYDWILRQRLSEFSRHDCHKALRSRFQLVARLKKALEVLTERHIISPPQERATGARSGVFHVVNPALLDGSVETELKTECTA